MDTRCPVPMMHCPDRASAEARAQEAYDNLLAVLKSEREGFLARVAARKAETERVCVP